MKGGRALSHVVRHPESCTYVVQCPRCLKWRLIPSKEKYEAIISNILKRPFLCKDAFPWHPNASCEDPAEIEPRDDDKYIWSRDEPNTPLPPSRWDRQFKIRSEGASKFGDIYYISPFGKKLRSKEEVKSFLKEHEDYANKEGVTLDQFSFKPPKPLFEGYVGRKHKSSDEYGTNGPRKRRGAKKIQEHINIMQVKPFSRQECGGSSSMYGHHLQFDRSECKLTNQSDIGRSFLPVFPLFWKRKRSTRNRQRLYNQLV